MSSGKVATQVRVSLGLVLARSSKWYYPPTRASGRFKGFPGVMAVWCRAWAR